MIRQYFFYLDSRGLLFLQDTKHKNFVSSIKDRKILNFFFKQLQVNNTNQYLNIPYVSKCGKELNYLATEDSYAPLVLTPFHDNISDIKIGQNEKQRFETMQICHSDLSVQFNPKNLRICSTQGRLYHLLNENDHIYLNSHFALLHPILAQDISQFLIYDNDKYKFSINGETYDISEINRK